MKKRYWITIILALALYFYWGTAQADEPEPEPATIECFAGYQPLTPYEYLGWDTCGAVWKLIVPQSHRPQHIAGEEQNDLNGIRTMGDNPDFNDPICVYWNLETGEYAQIPCPEPGSVTRRVPAPEEGRR